MASKPRRDPATPMIHRLKVTIRRSKPPIWRRIEVPSGLTLARLHLIIQVAFGWQNYHMWMFETGRGNYGTPDRELDILPATAIKLQTVAPRRGGRLEYLYDFGDDWEHTVVVEDVLAAEPELTYPRCVTGRGAGPPEDCGGIWGYLELQEVLADPDHEEHQDRLEWLGLDSAADFDPAEFDLDEINRALKGLAATEDGH
jgi:hypothetical protein